eukprot:1317214-Amorphochlora_amoeboformis.AAC.2
MSFRTQYQTQHHPHASMQNPQMSYHQHHQGISMQPAMHNVINSGYGMAAGAAAGAGSGAGVEDVASTQYWSAQAHSHQQLNQMQYQGKVHEYLKKKIFTLLKSLVLAVTNLNSFQ